MDVLAAPDVIDGFVKRVLAMQAAWVVAGEDGLARVPASADKRMVTLLWSRRSEADRRGAQMVSHPRVKPLSLKDLYVDVFPKLTQLGRLVGVACTSGAPTEIEPAELARRLRSEAVDVFLRKAKWAGSLSILQGADGPAFVMSKHTPGAQMLPCWLDRVSAQARIAGPLQNMVVTDVPLTDFLEKMLPWLAETRRTVAPAYCEGDGVLELTADALKACLDGSSAAAMSAVTKVA